MRYIPPFGVNVPDAPYVNGNASTGEQGSIPPAAVFEEPQREILGVIEKSGLTPTATDLLQMAKGIQSSHLIYAQDTGYTNNISVALDPPIAVYRPGLTINVRIRRTNTGAVRINAGAGTVPVRKINGAELNEDELPAGAIVTLTFDGTAFQTSSVGFGGGDTEIFQVKIPYVVDSSPTRDIINANFSPEITEISAGDMLAVKIANTNYGPTIMYINNRGPYALRPNGGGMMLQGDVHAGDIVIMFFDGQAFSFAPNPEINSWVMYKVGPGQQFGTVEECLDAIRRKTIGANGYVHIQMTAQTVFIPMGKYAAIQISHPSADRIAIVGTMIGANPQWYEFRATGADAGSRALDAVFNANMLRTRYGTIIQLPIRGYPDGCAGIIQTGPGTPVIHSILIMGNRPGIWPQGWGENGIATWNSSSISCYNVAVWGAAMGYRCDSSRLACDRCWASANTHWGFSTGGSAWISAYRSGSFGNGDGGHGTHHSSFHWLYYSVSLCNGGVGVGAYGGSCADTWYQTSLGNGVDYQTAYNATINSCWTISVGTTSPAWNTVGNLNGLIVLHQPIEWAPPPL